MEILPVPPLLCAPLISDAGGNWRKKGQNYGSEMVEVSDIYEMKGVCPLLCNHCTLFSKFKKGEYAHSQHQGGTLAIP